MQKFFSMKLQILQKKHPACNLSVASASESLMKYQPAVSYQKLLAEADYFYHKNDYKQFMAEYIAAENYYSLFSINNYGLNHLPLYYYILNKKNNSLIVASIAFYLNDNNNTEAFSLLKYLETIYYPADSTRNLQQRLAVNFAKNDYELKKTAHPKSNIIFYTGNTKWFRYFNRKYRQELGRLTGKFWVSLFSIF